MNATTISHFFNALWENLLYHQKLPAFLSIKALPEFLKQRERDLSLLCSLKPYNLLLRDKWQWRKG